MLYVLLVFAGLVFTSINSQAATNPAWDFTGDRQPTYKKLYSFGVEFTEVGCDGWPDVLYDNYATLYPDFRPLMAVEGMRRKWRKSIIAYGYDGWDSFNHCFYSKLSDRIRDLPYELVKNRVFYCGVIAKKLNPQQTVAAKDAEELIDYLVNGSIPAGVSILLKDRQTAGIKLNADIRFYLERMMDALAPPGHAMREFAEDFINSGAVNALSKERRQFVDAAFNRRDYRAVVDTTKPC